MSKYIVPVLCLVALAIFLLSSRTYQIPIDEELIARQELEQNVWKYLEDKDSPLAQETEFLLAQKHWKLLIAISAIESQYCKRQLGNNCFGVGGDNAYRHYSSYRASIVDANDLINYWQEKGKWLTIETMNCSYVVPCNQNWVRVVNSVLAELNQYERSPGAVSQ